MEILLAEAMGFCFGVRDALEQTRLVADPEQVTIYGELVHNEQVQVHLEQRGFRSVPEQLRVLPDTPGVLITAHGVSDRERARLLEAGKEVLDTTCPLVRRAHKMACFLRDQGYFVVVIGRAGHVEVQGLVGDLPRHAVLSRPEEAAACDAERLAVICQTTTPPSSVPPILEAIRAANPQAEVRFVDTICKPTRDRQQAVVRLLERVQALVVVGGRHSNNTRALAQMAEERGIPWTHVQVPEDLQDSWFMPFRQARVGLTAGTSTPDETLRGVHLALLRIASRLAPARPAPREVA